jgi:hypothetical protein
MGACLLDVLAFFHLFQKMSYKSRRDFWSCCDGDSVQNGGGSNFHGQQCQIWIGMYRLDGKSANCSSCQSGGVALLFFRLNVL